MTIHHDNYNTAALKIIEKVGKKIVLGLPLGIGKPIGLVNALYKLACDDSTIDLTIMTGLTLSRPTLTNDLERRFVQPILERMLKDYEDPLYENARLEQNLPRNIRVIEFFLSPGKYLHNKCVQENYINSAYTCVVRDTINGGVNVIAQQVSQLDTQYSLSSNSDLFTDLGRELKKGDNKKIAIVAEINLNLPFMYGEAVLEESFFTDIVNTGQHPALFAIPSYEISTTDHLIGFYSSLLIKDDSCLQIGIGKLGNAVSNSIIMRHKNNADYLDLIKNLSVTEKFGETIASLGSSSPFEKGIYASTEMFSDEYMSLMKENILTKTVYDHIGLQRLLNSRKITEVITPDFLDILENEKLISKKITHADFVFLQEFGIFRSDLQFTEREITLDSGEIIFVTDRAKIIENCLGTTLKSGKIMHAGFFMGSLDFYQFLRGLSLEERKKIDMTSISRTNQLTWNPELLALQRQHARFINSSMMVTLGGTIVSDGLQDLQEVSGVGGQFDFVYMAQMLPGARSIINCNSIRRTKTGDKSTIIWNYTNITIPRYLRDIVVTEYGIADCRSKTDSEIIKEILNITDSRFQQDLLIQAKKAGKIAQNYEIPNLFKNNFPEKIESILKNFKVKGFFKLYPFGSDFTEEEQIIKITLEYLKKCSKLKLFSLIITSLFYLNINQSLIPYLERMGLLKPKTFKDVIYKKLLIYSLSLNLK